MDWQYIAMHHIVFLQPLTVIPLMDFVMYRMAQPDWSKAMRTTSSDGFEYTQVPPNLV